MKVMAPPKGSAVYKKKDGTLAVSSDRKTVTWTPVAPRGAPPGVTVKVEEITSRSKVAALGTLISWTNVRKTCSKPQSQIQRQFLKSL